MPKDCPKPPLITERARPTVHFYKMPYPRRPREQKRTIPSTPRGELPRPDQSLGRRIHIFLRILAAHSSFSISCAWPRMNCTGVSWLALGDGDATMHICSARHLCKALGLSRMRLCVFGAGLWSSRAYICMCVCVCMCIAVLGRGGYLLLLLLAQLVSSCMYNVRDISVSSVLCLTTEYLRDYATGVQ
jgi:hypothetical protein